MSGEDQAVAQATRALEELKHLVERQGSVSPDDVDRILAHVTGAEPCGSDADD